MTSKAPGHWLASLLQALVLALTASQFDRLGAAADPGADRPRVPTEVDPYRGLVLNAYITPHWIGQTDEFWYRRELPEGHEFVIVDAATGEARPAFDASAMAAALKEIGFSSASRQELPFDYFEFEAEPTAISFVADSANITCSIDSGHCRKFPLAPPNLSVSPDGRQAVFTKDGNLWLRDMQTGQETALTADGSPDAGYGIYSDAWWSRYIPRKGRPPKLASLGASWSPDSARVLVSYTDQRHVQPYPFVEYVPVDGSFRPKLYNIRLPLVGEMPPIFEWFVFNIERGVYVRVQLPYERLLDPQRVTSAVRRFWWSENGSTLYAAAMGKDMAEAFLFRVSTESGVAEAVISESGQPHADLSASPYSPPNVWLLGGGEEVIWYSNRDGWGHLYLYDGSGGKLKNQITSGPWLVRDIVHVDEEQRLVYFTASGREPGNPYYRYLYRIGLDGRDLTVLTPEPMDHMITSPIEHIAGGNGARPYEVVSSSGRYFVANASRVDRPTESAIRRTSDGSVIAVFERANADALFDSGYQAPETVTTMAADGETPIWGVLYRPIPFDPNKSYPVIDAQYTSPMTAVAPHNFVRGYNAQPQPRPSILARLGFAVVIIDGRGTAFRSQAFSKAMYGHLDTMYLEDHRAAIEELATVHPWLNAKCVGIYGSSFGGWGTLRGMLAFPDFFKVGAARTAPGSLQSMNINFHWNAFEDEPLYSNGSHLRPSPGESPLNWEHLDNSNDVENLKGELMIVMGGLDENVMPGSTLRFVNSLIEAGKDFDFLFFPQSNHGTTHNEYSNRKTIEFFEENLNQTTCH